MMENMEFEEKVDIADLVLLSKPIKLEEIEMVLAQVLCNIHVNQYNL